MARSGACRDFSWFPSINITYMGFLVSRTAITFEFVITTERLRIAEVSKATGYGGVLFHVYAEIKEVFILTRHRLAVQAPCLRGQYPLEDVIDPRVLLLWRSVRRCR